MEARKGDVQFRTADDSPTMHRPRRLEIAGSRLEPAKCLSTAICRSQNTSFTRLDGRTLLRIVLLSGPKCRNSKREEFIMAMGQLDTTLGSGAAVVVRSGQGQTLGWGRGGKVRIIAGAGSTDACFSLVEVTDAPGIGAPLHVHHGEAEAFYILDGTIELTCGNEVVVGHAGDFLYAPKDVPHKYLVVGDKPARLLLLFSRPGFEKFFAEI